MMAEKPKRIIDRERQWRKVDAGHYVSPKGRFHATRDESILGGGSWLLVDTEGEFEPEWLDRWRDARTRVEEIEFAAPAPLPITLDEDEIVDEFHDVYCVKARRGDDVLFEIVVRRGWVVLPETAAMTFEEAEAFATALMLATHRAAQLDRKEV